MMKFSDIFLKKVAGQVLAMIEKNIKEGVDVEGKPFQYSTNPFFLPFTNDVKRALRGKLKSGQANNIFQFVVSKKSGSKGLIVPGGYKSFKEFVYPHAAKEYLTISGKMLRDMNVLSAQGNEIIIGFTQKEQAQKAEWFNFSGVGKSRKLWKFLGLRYEQQRDLAKSIEGAVAEEIKKMMDKMIPKL